MILAIDPGTTHSGVVWYRDGKVVNSEIVTNDEVRHYVDLHSGPIAIEMIASYGMAVGQEVFETCVWIGQFVEVAGGSEKVRLIYRKEVKMHICGNTKAKDANIRQALIDKFGGQEKAVGKKATQGPLYGVKSHMWAALAVAVTAAETQ